MSIEKVFVLVTEDYLRNGTVSRVISRYEAEGMVLSFTPGYLPISAGLAAILASTCGDLLAEAVTDTSCCIMSFQGKNAIAVAKRLNGNIKNPEQETLRQILDKPGQKTSAIYSTVISANVVQNQVDKLFPQRA